MLKNKTINTNDYFNQIENEEKELWKSLSKQQKISHIEYAKNILEFKKDESDILKIFEYENNLRNMFKKSLVNRIEIIPSHIIKLICDNKKIDYNFI